MKYRLSPKTIKNYTASQIVAHIERIQHKLDLSEYRFDEAYGKVYKAWRGHYVFHCSLNKSNLVDVLDSFYIFIEQVEVK